MLMTMETQNEVKAKEICGCSNCYHNFKGKECLKDNGILCSLKPCLKNTLEAMQWKDEEHTKEKQQWIDEVCEFLKKQAGGFWIDHLVYELKKAIKGE